MQKRAVRRTLLALLLTCGAGAVAFAWTTHTKLGAVAKAELDRLQRIDQLDGWLAEIAAAQHAYVAPGQPLQPALDRVAALLPRVQTEVADLGTDMQSVAARATIERLSASVRTIADADNSAREQLDSGQFLWAAEIMFGPAREAHADAVSTLRELRDAGRSATTDASNAAVRRTSIAMAAVATLWVLGLVLLVPVPARAPAQGAPTAEASESSAVEPASGGVTTVPPYGDVEAPPLSAPVAPVAATIATPSTPASAASVSIDLSAAAAICTEISRVTSGDQVGALLGRIATTLDATGVIVWMGAGEELFAAAASGYDLRLISRMGVISRGADNAVATAWRTCELRVVGAGGDANGAIVAPMFGPDGCIGVLAVETHPHREADAAVRAVTEMFAAQLATTLAAWPAPSVASDADLGRLDAPPGGDFRMPKASGA
jgi:hypothetical protein